jgi:hypothetical protein
MDPISERQSRVLWSFWLACGLAATGAIAPFLLTAGGPNRMAFVAIPFGIAAIAMAVNALTYRRGRSLATALYFLAGIALVYGMLSMVAVPLRLAVVGICTQQGPTACPAGSELPLTAGESNGFAIAMLTGALAILVAFFGLWIMFRTRPKLSPPAPVRNEANLAAPIADVAIKAAAESETAAEALPPTPPETQPASSTLPPDPVAPALPPKPPAKPRVKRAPKPQAELPAPAEPLELPASSSPDEPPSDAPTSS